MAYMVIDDNGEFLFHVSIHGLKQLKGGFDRKGRANKKVLVERLRELGGDEDAERVLKAKEPIILTDGTG